MKFGIVVFPGSNCDKDCYHVCGRVVEQDVFYLWHRETSLKDADCVIIPGGFSYGDYLRVGAMASRSPIIDSVISFAQKGGMVVGICNGFQVLTESQLLPGALIRNSSLNFICETIPIKVINNKSRFTSKYEKDEVIRMPVAHMDGNYYAEPKLVKELEECGRVVFKYSDEEGNVTEGANPNGSVTNIAGICNKEGNVLGMMPHPERCSEDVLAGRDGRRLFESIIDFMNR